MPGGLGKQFEQKVRENWMTSFPKSLFIRLYDQQTGYKVTSQNISDALAFNEGILYIIEIKSVQKTSFPFQNLSQYAGMEAVTHVAGVKPVVIIWFVQLDMVIALPILTIKKMKKDGLKSFNPKTVDRKKYYIVNVPSVKLRTFMNSDYTCLKDLLSNEEIEKYGRE